MSSLCSFLVAGVLSFAACSSPAQNEKPVPALPESDPPAEALVAKRSAKDITLDGFVLGDTYATLMAKAPYDKPCDDDPVDTAGSTRAMVYGGEPCRGNEFPDDTTVILYIPSVRDNEFEVPIRAVVWLGGTYFDARSNLGLEIGDGREVVRDLLGAPRKIIEVPDRLPLSVEVYDGSLYAVFDGDVAAGYGIGALPTSPAKGDEHWRVVGQMYRRYTKRVTSLSASETKERCEKLLDRYIALMRLEPDKAAEADELARGREKAIEQCARKVSAADFACAEAAKTFSDLRDCERSSDEH